MILRLGKYIKRRFPIIPLTIFTLFVGGSAEHFLSGSLSYRGPVAGITFLLFFFHLRLLDEFKDYNFDSTFHRDRPLQTGDISINDIKFALVLNFIILLAGTLILDFGYSLLIPLGYSFLMFKEFFIEDFYHKNSVLYLISHELVFFSLYLFIFSYVNRDVYMFDTAEHFLLYIYFIVPVTLIEIGRKMNHRYDSSNNKTDDTYVYIWGEENTIKIFFGLCAANAAILAYLGNQPLALIITALYILGAILATNTIFKQMVMKNHMTFTMLGGYIFPILLFIV